MGEYRVSRDPDIDWANDADELDDLVEELRHSKMADPWHKDAADAIDSLCAAKEKAEREAEELRKALDGSEQLRKRDGEHLDQVEREAEALRSERDQLREQIVDLRRIVGFAKRMRACVYSMDDEGDAAMEKFDAAIAAGKP